jgi:integrative and conjugative element protein (TIGR02256 family)
VRPEEQPASVESVPVVWMTAEIIAAMAVEATRHYPLETGGILLGYANASGTQVVVHACVGPGPRAVHRRHGFVPDHVYHELETARIYADSGRLWSYLGDWHSHPSGTLVLSRTDRRTLARIARTRDARVPKPLMIVLAGVPTNPPLAHAPSGRPWADCAAPSSAIAFGGWRAGAWQILERPSALAATLGGVRAAMCHVRLISDEV